MFSSSKRFFMVMAAVYLPNEPNCKIKVDRMNEGSDMSLEK